MPACRISSERGLPVTRGPQGQSSWVFLTQLFCSPGLDDAPDGRGVGLGSVLHGPGGLGAEGGVTPPARADLPLLE